MVLGHTLIQRLQAAHLLPPACRRVVVDVQVNEVVKVYYECFGSEELLEVLLPPALTEGIVIETGRTDG